MIVVELFGPAQLTQPSIFLYSNMYPSKTLQISLTFAKYEYIINVPF